MRTIAAVLFFLMMTVLGSAQVAISLNYGYRFGGSLPVRVDNQFGELKMQDSGALTADLSYRVSRVSSVYVGYAYQSAAVDFSSGGFFGEQELFDATVQYFTVGTMHGIDGGIGFNPFGKVGLGVGLISPRNSPYEAAIRPAVNMAVGFNYYFSEWVGVRASAGLFAPLQFGNAGLFCDTSGGCGVSAGASSQIVQGDISGGLVVRLPQRNTDDAYMR